MENGGRSDALPCGSPQKHLCLHLVIPRKLSQPYHPEIDMSPPDDLPVPSSTSAFMNYGARNSNFQRTQTTINYQATIISTRYESLRTRLCWTTSDQDNHPTGREPSREVCFKMLRFVHLSPCNWLYCFSKVRLAFEKVLVCI